MKKYTLGLYEKSMPGQLTWKEKLQSAKQAGFDYVEISIDETDEKLARLEWTGEERYELKKAIQETGIPIYTMCLSGHRKYPLGSRDEAVRTRGLEIMEKAVGLAADLGIRIIQLAGYDVYYEEGAEDTRALFEENLKKACDMAAQKGVMMGFETMETPFMDTVEKAMHYVNKMDSPYLGVYPDIGNLTNASLIYGKSVNDDIATGRGHIVATHLKETIPGHYREIPFGTGHTDYVKHLKLLKELGIRMFVGEFWYIGSPEWEKDLKFANDFLREKIEQVY
ncbi:L-ribulose-5-phosphate 3-epimerase [Anaerobium acetethylicum]|uniref:L-ribulose-5-phosphate 3-epimerase n=1 Tax=Anaerobium acetethylicum TaxID=1619234 RepID=A0A1D3TTB2_9FIRM|nr:L-ribulose-5-phosphate 3-epimerase [Anaerobium acetethylicum]SCP97177.1 L-ribulose-5-phosphate 3-epimerase/hexulose-6-phosphate isomerase [Anaerobium acetethylicum]